MKNQLMLQIEEDSTTQHQGDQWNEDSPFPLTSSTIHKVIKAEHNAILRTYEMKPAYGNN